MSASAAQALASNLVLRGRDPAGEIEALSGIAAWAGRFTPSVSLQPPDGVLLEVGSCLRLHRGLDNLLKQVHAGLDELGYESHVAATTTPHGAWLLALAGCGAVIPDSARLGKALGQLPVHLLGQPTETISGLELIGASTISDCQRLPRTGLTKRFGKALLEELDRAFGKKPEPREFYLPPLSFERRLELPALVYEASGLLFATQRLLPELEGYLSLCQAGIQELELVCRHEDADDTMIKIGFVQPTRSLERMKLLMREMLSKARLPAAVHTIVLMARSILPLDPSNHDLFQEKAETGEGALLLERLRIRLGRDAVASIAATQDHRPELAWKYCELNLATGSGSRRNRPLWLLPNPVACKENQFEITAGPERIESGWWDGADVTRDYFVARHRNGSRLWIFQDHSGGGWYVHGLFA